MSSKNKGGIPEKKKSAIQKNLHTEKDNKEKPPLEFIAQPLLSTALPFVNREIPLVSAAIPLVSARPPITLPRCWGLLPSRHWGKTRHPAGHKRELRPVDIGLLKFLGKVVTAPWQPLSMVKGVAERVKDIAKEE